MGRHPNRHHPISIHAPRGGATTVGGYLRPSTANFNPPAPCGAGQSARIAELETEVFQSTCPVWGRTASSYALNLCHQISIHLPRVGQDGTASPSHAQAPRFQSTCPVWGRTRTRGPKRNRRKTFQSTCPVWGRTTAARRSTGRSQISIHLPRVGQDVFYFPESVNRLIFQSTCPVWGRTADQPQQRRG